jgi:hypothetical protein
MKITVGNFYNMSRKCRLIHFGIMDFDLPAGKKRQSAAPIQLVWPILQDASDFPIISVHPGDSANRRSRFGGPEMG